VFVYTALGDSITAGSGATAPGLAYPSRLIAMLRRQHGTACTNILAHPGWTSAALTAAVFENSPAYLVQANVITIWIGGDNVAFAGLSLAKGAPTSMVPRAIQSYVRDLTVLVTGIRKVSNARIVLCTQYNPFPNSPLAVEAIDALNATTATAATNLHTELAPTHAWFAGREAELIQGYKSGQLQDALASPRFPVHPNNAGHQVIAEGLYPFLRT
jgi:acyl-CoA thioesterase I